MTHAEKLLRPAIGALAVVGVGIASYLTATHFAHTAPICTNGGCEVVQRSDWATFGSVPIAALGLVAFVAVLGSAALRTRLAALVGYAVALSGAMFAVYLIAVQATELHAICVWCVASDSIIVVLAALTAVRVLAPRT